MRQILVVDDDPEICRVVEEYLAREGFEVTSAPDGPSARDALARARPDLVLLDLMLGQEDGLVLGREMHQREIPFVIVSARQEPVDRVLGLELGADDFVTKPFDLRELLARIRSVLRRAALAPPRHASGTSRVLHFDGWRLDLIAYELTDPSGRIVDLTSTELTLLRQFAEHPGRVLTREQIAEDVLHKDWMVGDRSVDMLVSRLRNKIEPDPDNPSFIKTRRSLGYVFASNVTAEP